VVQQNQKSQQPPSKHHFIQQPQAHGQARAPSADRR
jgi:hypothetical protein